MEACEEARPFGQEEVVKMSQTSSAETGKPYGVARVCHVWEQARSTFYARQERAKHSREGSSQGDVAPSPWCQMRVTEAYSAGLGGFALSW
jgi:hypothetical protein